MTTYGNSFYGSPTLYGATVLVQFDASPMVARSSNYGEITVTWTNPTGAWDLLHLVRNSFGFPMTPDDGDLLVEQDGTAAASYTDSGAVPNNAGLINGQVYYYSIFVRKTSDQSWYKAANAIGISVKNYGTANLMYDYLPEIYKTLNATSFFDSNTAVNADLFNFIRVFAFEYDLLKTMAENVKNRYNMFELDGRLLAPLLNEFGITYEKEIGIQQARKLAANASAIYTKKGSAAGLRNFVTAYSGYSASLLPVKNLMLNTNDSSFEGTIGGWEPGSNTTISQITGAAESPVITPYAESTSPSGFPNIQKGLLKVVSTASGNTDFYCGLSAPKTKGIPVTAGAYYSFSIYGRTQLSGSRAVTLSVNWYDMTGTFISTSLTGTGNINSGTWTRVSLANVQAPATAYFAVPHVNDTVSAGGEIHYFDAVQFEKSATVTNFVDARRIDILLNANRVNWCTNPNFEAAITNWTPAEVGTISQSTATFYLGTACLALTSSGAGNSVAKYTGNPTVTPGGSYTVSAYVKSAAVSRGAYIQLDWYTSGNVFISSSAGTVVSTSTTAWTRISSITTAPSNAAYAQIVIKFVSTLNAEVHYVDAVLLEQTSTVNPYFDGTYGYYQTSDILWENGSSSTGRSFYYKNRAIITKRLTATVPDYIPYGAPWALFVAQTP